MRDQERNDWLIEEARIGLSILSELVTDCPAQNDFKEYYRQKPYAYVDIYLPRSELSRLT